MNTKGNSKKTIEPEFWTSTEFCSIIKVSPTTLKNLLGSNQIKGAVQVGKQWRIHKETFYNQIKEDMNNGK